MRNPSRPGAGITTSSRAIRFCNRAQSGLTVAQLRSANGLWTDNLRPNQRIFIPTVTTPTTQSYSRSGNDSELLAMLIMAESGNEPYTGQVAAGAVF